MPNYIQQLRQPQVFGGYDPNQEMMDLYAPPPVEMYDPNQDMGMSSYDPMPIQQPQVQQQQQSVDPTATYQRIMAAYTPETSARDRQNRLLDNYPGQYTPTTGDRWTAALVGLGERNRPNGDVLKVQNEILQGPRMRDIEDWKNQITPVGVASTNENARNIQERTLLSNAIQADTQAQRLAETARNNDMRAEGIRQRNMIADYVARGAKVISMPHSPTIWMSRADGSTFDTKIPTGALSEAEAISARGAEAVKTIQAGAAANPGRNMMVGADGQPMTPDATGGYAPTPGLAPGATKPTVPKTTGTTGAKTNTLEQRRILNDQLKEHFQLDPNSRKFIAKKGEVYDFRNRPAVQPDTWMPGNQEVTQADVEAYDAFRKSIDPTYVPPTGPSPVQPPVGDGSAPEGKVAPISRVEQQQRVQSGQYLEVFDTSGKSVGIVPNNAAGRAEAARLGYKVKGK